MAIPHRPVGTGATTVKIVHRTDSTYGRDGAPTGNINSGYFVFIGRQLWQKIGRPDRVLISRVKNRIDIYSAMEGTGYAVTNVQNNGMPRCSVGKEAIEQLELGEGEYEAQTDRITIWFVK